MNEPKRHHWWPILQSQHWTGASGKLYATKSSGESIYVNPRNIGLEGDLYTRYDLTGTKDLTIEKWFSSEIEGPFRETLDFLASLPGLRKVRLPPLPREHQHKEHTAKELGFIIGNYEETIDLPNEHRLSLSKYLSALLVRNPMYIRKLQEFHNRESVDWLKSNVGTDDFRSVVKTVALDNMLKLFDTYGKRIVAADFLFLKREAGHEFLFADAGIVAQEPWRSGPIPFEIHAALTPDLAVEVLPAPVSYFPRRGILGRVSNVGVRRFNRVVVGNAERFVFSRGAPPIEFIKKHFGKPAPDAYGYQWTNGRMETIYDRARDDYNS